MLLALLHVPLAADSERPPCAICEVGYTDCGVCLRQARPEECPAADALDTMATCDTVASGVLCEADGECGTSIFANNCDNDNWGGYRNNDVFRRIDCDPDAVPSCADCAAGAGGMCLIPIAFADCPFDTADELETLPSCDAVAEGDMCEGDGEMGTNTRLDNCGELGRHGRLDLR